MNVPQHVGPAGPVGPQGPQGPQGPVGLGVWFDGDGAPAVGVGINGDRYLNHADGGVWAKAAGAWTQVGTILGPGG